MKITKSQLKTIILEEAAKVKKEILLREQLEEVQKELEEVMGGPHGGGKKTFKSAKGDFVPSEFPGALVEKDSQEEDEEEMEETYSFEDEELEEMMKGMEEMSHEEDEEMEEEGAEHKDEDEEFSEEELEEMFKQMEEEMEEGAKMEEEGAKMKKEMEETAPAMEESKKYNLKESAEVLRMKKLAGLI